MGAKQVEGHVSEDHINTDHPVVSRAELWSYYLFYNGDAGVQNGWIASIVQLYQNDARRSPSNGGGACTADSTDCNLPVGGGMPTTTFVLIQQSVTSLFAAFIFISISGYGDYAMYGRNLLIFFTFLSLIAQAAFMFYRFPGSSADPLPYTTPMSTVWFHFFLQGVQQIAYSGSLVYFFALFPRLAPAMPEVRAAIERGDSEESIYNEIAFQRSRISMISTLWSNIGYFVPAVLTFGLIFAANPTANILAGDPTSLVTNNWILLFLISYWLVFALPWIVLNKPRPGPPVPKDVNIAALGYREFGHAVKLWRRLPQAWLYIIGFFFFADGNATMGILVGNLQNNFVSFNTLTNNLYTFAQAGTSVLGCIVFWWVGNHFKVPTKRMFQVTNLVALLVSIWGVVGIWAPGIGYKTAIEFYIENSLLGFFQAPFWAYQNTYLSDLIPPSKAYLFFSVFGICGRFSAAIGPLISALITAVVPANNTNGAPQSTWIAFIPTTIFMFIGFVIIQMTNPEKAKRDVIAFEEAEAAEAKAKASA
ncbi:autophagy-related protein 22-like protein [Polychytrium aggregatum]|uniref:autophagy-related protein 22-like protein n=1 Tax=Polychytrium aggregatum TaxID=110093 RepID=UPI0022FDDA8D|nr:autophagy-related protein 22-like protein [Polychytrium aggregatum]KAI9205630.1 autophagy-related protein 22-like protein [Polychytrium aggregatum]